MVTGTKTEQEPAVSEAVKKTAVRSGPKWEMEARERVRQGIKKFAKPLGDLVARDANEGDTRVLITDFLCDALGFDKYADLTTEYQVKGEFADYGLRVDKQLIAFLEVKRATTKLNAKHLRQVEMYAVNEGVEWVLLSNGAHWQVYHITGGLPVDIQLALDVNLLGEDSLAHKTNQLFYITTESFRRHLIDDLWQAKRATSPQSIGDVVCSEPVVAAIRKELKKRTGHSVEDKELVKLLRETVIRSEGAQK